LYLLYIILAFEEFFSHPVNKIWQILQDSAWFF